MCEKVLVRVRPIGNGRGVAEALDPSVPKPGTLVQRSDEGWVVTAPVLPLHVAERIALAGGLHRLPAWPGCYGVPAPPPPRHPGGRPLDLMPDGRPVEDWVAEQKSLDVPWETMADKYCEVMGEAITVGALRARDYRKRKRASRAEQRGSTASGQEAAGANLGDETRRGQDKRPQPTIQAPQVEEEQPESIEGYCPICEKLRSSFIHGMCTNCWTKGPR